MEIYVGSPETVYFRNYRNGQLMPLTGPPATVKIVDGQVVETLSVATVGTGVYSTDLLSLEEESFQVKWSSDGLDYTQTYQTITPYVEIYDLISASPDDATWEEMKDAEKYARFRIDSFTSQRFGKRYDAYDASGNGTDYLPLPRRLLQIKKLYENNNLVIDIDNDVNTFGRNVKPSQQHSSLQVDSTYDIAEWRMTGIDMRGWAFREGYKYLVEGYFGWDSVPNDVQICSKELISDYFCSDRKWREDYVTSLKNGDWTAQFDPAFFFGTGNSYVDAILTDYIWPRYRVL